MLWFASAGQQHPVFDVFTLLLGMFGLETRTSATCTTRWSPTSQPTSLTQAPLSTQARRRWYIHCISVYYICIHYLYFCILYRRKNATAPHSILFNWNQTCPGKNKGEYGRKNATAQYFTYFGDSQGKPTTRRGWVVNCQVFDKIFKSFWTEDILKTFSFRDNGIRQRADPASCDQPTKLSVG